MLCWSHCRLGYVTLRIESEEVKELMPSSFHFLYRNIPIASNQEFKLTLLNCVEESDARAEIFVLHFKDSRESDSVCTKSPLDAWLKKLKSSVTSENTNIEKKSEEHACEKGAPSQNQRESNSKGSKFTDEDIEGHPCWIERERRKYWNIKINELHTSREAENFSKLEWMGVLDTAWSLKKAELLKLRALQLQVLQEQFQTVHPSHYYQNVKKTSNDSLAPSKQIDTNIELISKILFCIQKENVELTDLSITKMKRVQSEERLHKYLYELKRASDALFKALSNQEIKLKEFEANVKKLEYTLSDEDQASTG